MELTLTFEQKRKYAEARHSGQHIPARDRFAVHCGQRDHEDKNASCTVFLTGNLGGVNCHGCGFHGSFLDFEMAFSQCDIETAKKNIAAITGATLHDSGRRFVAAHTYFDFDGMPASEKRRYVLLNGEKDFDWYHRNEAGRWVLGWPSNMPRFLYNQPELTTANLILYTEGEKCADLVKKKIIPYLWPQRQADGLRIAVTTNPEGAWKPGAARWREEYNKSFSNVPVVFFEDNDLQGRTLAEHVSRQIYPAYATSVRRKAFSNEREGYDIADWIEEHDPATLIADFERMVESAPLWKPQVIERPSVLVEAVEWVSTADPQIEYRIDGIIQTDANGIIAAEPKTGKSLVALDLLLSLACGVPWLNRKVPKRVRCAYISREDSPMLTKVRIKGFLAGKGLGGVDVTNWLWCNTREQMSTFNIEEEDDFRIMAHDLKERGIEFAVLDVLNRIHGRDENNNTEMAAVVERINQLGREANCSIGLVHHVSKENSSGRFFTRIRGASAIHGWTEWSIGLTLENPNNEGKKLIRRAEFESKAGESAPISFTVEFGGGNLRLQLVDPMAYDPAGREGTRRWQ
jgi:hypothetical protein